MSPFYLIRHTQVEVKPDIPSTEWLVSEHGRIQTQKLAAQIDPLPTLILTSIEPKAIKTGEILGEIWNVPVENFPNLHEHERGKNNFISNKQAWHQMVADYLKNPNELRMGRETAVEAAQRLETAIKSARTQFPHELIAFVTHGRILTAFVAQHNSIAPVQYWRDLTLPAALQLNLIDYKLQSTINLSQ